jgi:hypothetical protein
VVESLTNQCFEFTFFGRVMSLDMAFQGIICCLASLDFSVTWKTEHALVFTESSSGVGVFVITKKSLRYLQLSLSKSSCVGTLSLSSLA